MLGLCCDKTCGATMNYDERDDSGGNDRNEDGNNNDSAASGSGYDGPIFNPITMPWSRV